jgi:hypothetical protein
MDIIVAAGNCGCIRLTITSTPRGSLVVSLVATFVGYDILTAQVEAQSAATGLAMGSGAIVAGIALNVAITLLLWYLGARKGFVIAKWIIVLFFLFTVVTSISGIFAGGLAVHEGLSLLAIVLQAAAVYFLFQPDAKAWFAGERTAAATPED